MLIQQMLGKHDIKHYYFAEYSSIGCVIVSLLLKKGTDYYDLRNNCYIEGFQINFKKHLTDYVKYDKQYISTKTAYKLAEPYRKQFNKDCLEHKRAIKLSSNKTTARENRIEGDFIIG